jgi:hypothetical protein
LTHRKEKKKKLECCKSLWIKASAKWHILLLYYYLALKREYTVVEYLTTDWTKMKSFDYVQTEHGLAIRKRPPWPVFKSQVCLCAHKN